MNSSQRKVSGQGRHLWAAVIPLFIFMIAGCTSHSKRPVNLITPGQSEKQEQTGSQSTQKKKSKKVVWVQQPLDQNTLLGSPTDQQPDYLMNFDDIAVPDFIEAMMAGVFKKNYLITEEVKKTNQRFTIKMSEDLKADRAFQLFKNILALFNVSVTKKENTYVFNAVKQAVVTLKGPIIYGRKPPAQLGINDNDEVTFLVPFYNISPESLKTILLEQLPSSAVVFPIGELSLLVISGNYQDIKYTLSFIDLLDRAQFKDKSILMIAPEYWDIGDFQEKLEELLTAEGLSMEVMGKTRGIMFIPIEKLNRIIVITGVPEWADRVLYWLDKLDVPEAAGEGNKVYAYRLKNVEVGTVADVLNAYRSGDLSGIQHRTSTRLGSRTRSNTTLSSSGSKDKNTSRTGQEQPKVQPDIESQTGMRNYNTEIGEDGVAIIPVIETNSVVIISTPKEYKEYLDIIKRIDIPRNQVFVEVIIGEVSLDTSTQLGLEFWINRYLYRTRFGTKGGLGVYRGTDDDGNDIIPTGSNFFVNGTLDGTQFEVLINALVQNSKINIISTPKITVLENEEAEISVGSDVPVISSESGISVGQTVGSYYPFRSVQYINTGIILKVRAAILSDHKIALDIEQEISEALENKTSDISSPEILKRNVKTTMVVKEGEIAFIGGLFQNKISTSGSGIPVLSQIPLLGNLFKNSKKQLKKTELVVFINSKTLRRQSDMKEIVDGVKKMFSDKIYTQE